MCTGLLHSHRKIFGRRAPSNAVNRRHISSPCHVFLIQESCIVTSLILYSSLSDTEDDEPDSALEGIRLNKVFKATHSRREADALILAGRVTVNGKKVDIKGGYRVKPYLDVVALDGNVIRGWEDMNHMQKNREKVRTTRESPITLYTPDMVQTSHFDYVKYWKPEGITCTTDSRRDDNIIDAIRRGGYRPKHRIYPVGRLDKDSSGLILLTSDGRVPNAVLRGEHKQAKVYMVRVDKAISDNHIQRLRDGIIITTVAHRDGNRAKPLTAKTRPCQVERIGSHLLKITLIEGRNRQIRKMLGALDYTVVELQRVEFMGIKLQDNDSFLRCPGDWKTLNNREMKMIETALQTSSLQ
jgi:23S rRNA pseudouridine2604 synthase